MLMKHKLFRSILVGTLLMKGALVVAPAVAQNKPYFSADAQQQKVAFAPGIVSTKSQFEINAVFNKAGDNVIFSRCDKAFKKCAMMQSDYRQKQWQKPENLPFSGEYFDADPYYTSDYSQLYFISKRPVKKGGEPAENFNLWRVDVLADGWGKPEYLADLSSGAHDLYPSFTDSGDFYFPSFRNDKRLFYVARKTPTGFASPEALPKHIYGDNASIGDSVISRDGKMIVFSIRGREDSLGNGDLYVSYWKDGKWTTAKSLGDKVNSPDHEFTPIFSPDGEYLFFTRIENGLGNVYQIHTSLLDW